jgi:prevent-host-death family protein
MSTIGAYEAKTKLPELLRQVKRGKRFTITVRGEPVAELVPSGTRKSDAIAAAVEDMQKFERIHGVSAEDIAAWIEEGRQ